MDFLWGAALSSATTVYLSERFPNMGINFESLSQCLRLGLEGAGAVLAVDIHAASKKLSHSELPYFL